MFTLTKAMPGDEALCMEIIADGRQFQQEQGFVQWTEAYPALPDIAEDIKTQRAYLLREDGEVLGYLCLDFDGEPAYDAITGGSWLCDEPYAVLRRLALNARGRGRGLTRVLFDLAAERSREQGIRCLRADTDPENARMQHILEKVGFEKRGIIIFQGSGKFAYEKRI
ncbi:MAG: GNAT family N-acetyltransferase [Clostridiales bacterium]|nr:GNAT family N-acetyltransferase [Clostridiales bacterium]